MFLILSRALQSCAQLFLYCSGTVLIEIIYKLNIKTSFLSKKLPSQIDNESLETLFDVCSFVIILKSYCVWQQTLWRYEIRAAFILKEFLGNLQRN